MDIVRKLPTDLLYIIVQYLPNRNKEKYRLKYLYDKYVYYHSFNLKSVPYCLYIRYDKLARIILQKINEYTKEYLKVFYRRGNRIKLLKDLPFFISCPKCKKMTCQNEYITYITYNIFYNEMYIFNGYYHPIDSKHKNK